MDFWLEKEREQSSLGRSWENKVSCPTLVIYGEKDRANKNASIELANMLIDAELQVFNGAGHEINIEAPDKLVETLRVFFGRV